jgi:hypothetical protein
LAALTGAGRDRPPRQEEIGVALDPALERPADPDEENEINQQDDVVDSA